MLSRCLVCAYFGILTADIARKVSAVVKKMILEELENFLQLSVQRIGILEKNLDILGKKQNKLQEKQRETGKNLRGEEHKVWETQECIIVKSRLPQRAVRLRRQLLETRKAAESEDITVRKQESLREETESLLQQLQEMCEHPFVFSYDGYGGSYSDDYDDQYRGRRTCAVCGFSETSQSYSENKYETLTLAETRLIKRDLREREKQDPTFNKFTFLSLSRIREVFLASAGNRNAIWPEKETGKKKEMLENAKAA